MRAHGQHIEKLHNTELLALKGLVRRSVSLSMMSLGSVISTAAIACKQAPSYAIIWLVWTIVCGLTAVFVHGTGLSAREKNKLKRELKRKGSSTMQTQTSFGQGKRQKASEKAPAEQASLYTSP